MPRDTAERPRLIVTARFPYAASIRGEPHAGVPVSADLAGDDVLRTAVGMLVDAMECVGREYHRCQSMPSLDPRDYALAVGGIKVTAFSQITAQTMYDNTCEATVELLYVGPFGPEQERQARQLGGPASLRTARAAWERAKTIVACDGSSGA